eukprot:SAG11_NODE_4952_length_1711_cov_3.070720_1_plen_151_part_00
MEVARHATRAACSQLPMAWCAKTCCLPCGSGSSTTGGTPVNRPYMSTAYAIGLSGTQPSRAHWCATATQRLCPCSHQSERERERERERETELVACLTGRTLCCPQHAVSALCAFLLPRQCLQKRGVSVCRVSARAIAVSGAASGRCRAIL